MVTLVSAVSLRDNGAVGVALKPLRPGYFAMFCAPVLAVAFHTKRQQQARTPEVAISLYSQEKKTVF